MKKQHTPGPWKIGTPPPNGEQTIGTQKGLMVAVATTGANTPTEANANLIAAAPELLEALQDFLNWSDSVYYGEDTRRELVRAKDKASAAIAKATGEQK